MSRVALPSNPLNGGLPEPPEGETIRVVAAHHDACGASTRVRLPGSLNPRAVRRFHCARCAAAFEASRIEEIDFGADAEPVAEPEPAVDPLEAWVQSARRVVPPLETAPAAKPAPAKPEPKPKAVAPKPKPKAAEPKRAPKPKAAKAKRAMPKLPKRPTLTKPKLTKPKLTKPKVTKPKVTLPKFATKELSLPKLPSLRPVDPDSRSWKLLSLLVAVALVLGGLLLLRGGDDEVTPAAPTPAELDAAATAGAASGAEESGGGAKPEAGAPIAKPSKDTEFIRESTFSLALPAGWERIEPPAGATFAAVADDGSADATLWIKQDPKLEFPTFVSQSLTQLEALAGSAQIVERIPGPTAEATVVRLAADAPEGQPTYEVTLRVAGPYRYYLATSVQPDASEKVVEGAELIPGTFTPEAEG